VTDFGADPNGGTDSFTAFNNAIAQGTKSNQVWRYTWRRGKGGDEKKKGKREVNKKEIKFSEAGRRAPYGVFLQIVCKLNSKNPVRARISRNFAIFAMK
jgi:hypothetical protein